MYSNLIGPNEKEYLSNGAVNVIEQSNSFLFQNLYAEWHNDSFATQYFHYVTRAQNGSRLLDPTQPLPSLNDVKETYFFNIFLSLRNLARRIQREAIR
jgi:hypothetical protein